MDVVFLSVFEHEWGLAAHVPAAESKALAWIKHCPGEQWDMWNTHSPFYPTELGQELQQGHDCDNESKPAESWSVWYRQNTQCKMWRIPQKSIYLLFDD